MLLCWIAGPGNVVRTPDDLTVHRVRITEHDGHGQLTLVTTEPRTGADQAGIENDVNTYLAEVGAPPRRSR